MRDPPIRRLLAVVTALNAVQTATQVNAAAANEFLPASPQSLWSSANSFLSPTFVTPAVLERIARRERAAALIQPFNSLGRLHQPQSDDTARSPVVAPGVSRALQDSECANDADCLDEYGLCEKGLCRGFDPDLLDARRQICIDGLACPLPELTGLRIGSDFEVIAIKVNDLCGASDALPATKSIFETNRWRCADSSQSKCLINLGTSQRADTSAYVQEVRLCGCPAIDGTGSGKKCSTPREFFVPLARISSQECSTNAHCAGNHALAYCVGDHCGGSAAIAASTGLKVFQCLTDQDCTVQSLASDVMNEALKVLPVAAEHGCGETGALDPSEISDAALPCIVDVDNDGVCEVNLGIASGTGTTRLCGCADGSDCDDATDFSVEMGLVNVGECVVDADCAKLGAVCVDQSCIEDDMPPYVVALLPANNSIVVPPVNSFTLIWNENVQFSPKAGRKLVIAAVESAQDSVKWEVEVKNPATFKQSEAGYAISLSGRRLTITPDISLATLPEDKFIIGYEGGIVTDRSGNPNVGAVNLMFTIAADGGCKALYVTGFSTTDVNPNGLYTPEAPINGHAAFKGGTNEVLHLYWKKPNDGQPGDWIMSAKTDEKHFIAYADLELVASLGGAAELRPPSGTWRKWSGSQWISHPDVRIACTDTVDRTFPKLVDISPRIGAVGVPFTDTEIVLTFSKPINYGHWAFLTLIERRDDDQSMASDEEPLEEEDEELGERHEVAIPTDFEAGARGQKIFANGTETVVIKLHNELKPGTIYDLTADLGALTDLAYNPWGPVAAGVLWFTTYGASCPPFPHLGYAYEILSDSKRHGHGDVVSIRCARGYTVLDSATGERSDTLVANVTCEDGEWADLSDFACMASCDHYYELGAQYTLSGVEQGMNSDGRFTDGTALKVSCSPDSVLVAGTGKAETVCRNGVWTSFDLVCGASCGPFPSLGSSYRVTFESGAATASSTVLGSRRIVSCLPPAVAVSGKEPAYVICEENGWSPLTLKCHLTCDTDPVVPRGIRVVGVLADEASAENSYQVKCDDGFRSLLESGTVSTRLSCFEGRWELEEDLKCVADCGQFPAGEAYTVEAASGKGEHGSTATVSCAPGATQTLGSAREEVVCHDGLWDLKKIVCNAPCKRPDLVLGRSYVAVINETVVEQVSQGRYKHGSTATLFCASGAVVTAGLPPAPVVCSDGQWVSVAPQANATTAEQQLSLHCEGFCGPFVKDAKRYTDASADDNVNDRLVVQATPPGSTRRVACRPGYSLWPPASNGTFVCANGAWTEADSFECLADCGPDAIAQVTGSEYALDDVSSTSDLRKHGETIKLMCAPGKESLVSGVRSALVRCINGRYESPAALFCDAPSCRDGLKNGDEEGVDCGGSQCGTCTHCQLGSSKCTPSCRDGLKNGDEEGVDCGGSQCDTCGSCVGLPTEVNSFMAVVRVADGKMLSYAEASQVSAWTQGSEIGVFCAAGLHDQTASPSSRFQRFKCSSTGKWMFPDGAKRFAVSCNIPSCSDKTLNGDEWDVDCGGSCPSPCPSCSDGIRNNDEISVDCGGEHCFPCQACGIRVFKSLNLNTVKITALQSTDTASSSKNSPPLDWSKAKQISSTEDASFADHGSYRRVTCSNSKASSLSSSGTSREPLSEVTMQCENGRWLSVSGASSIEEMSCGDGTSIYVSDPAAAVYETMGMMSFQVPQLAKPTNCDSTDTNSCCELPQQLEQLLSAECGALLYSQKTTQVDSFCSGSCAAQLTASLTRYRSRTGNFCEELVPVFEELLQVVCVENGGVRCFASAGETLKQVQDPLQLTGTVLEDACKSLSCFESNLRYFELIRQLLLQSSSSTKAAARRSLLLRIDDETPSLADVLDGSEVRARSSLEKLIYESVLSIADAAGVVDAGISDFDEPHVMQKQPLHRRLAALNGGANAFLAVSASSQSVQSLMQEYRYSRSLLKFMCLKDAAGRSCAPAVRTLVSQDQKAGGNAILAAAASSLLGSTMCSDPCVVLVTRNVGQVLYEYGKGDGDKIKADPYKVLLGLLMRAFGRIACQASNNGRSCGELFGSHILFGGFDGGASRSPSLLAALKAASPECTCPVAWLSDGHCDVECFNKECAWDGDDCRLRFMFPSVAQRLERGLKLEDQCNPFNTDFICGRNGEGVICREAIQAAMESEGCCAASRFELLRELLSTEMGLRGESGVTPGGLVLDRSTSYIEASCGVSMDRGCSRGLKRSQIKLSLTFPSLTVEDNSEKFVQTIRHIISDNLAIPIADILSFSCWPYHGTSCDIIIDSGASTSEIFTAGQRNNATIERAVSEAAAPFSVDALVPAGSPSRQLNEPVPVSVEWSLSSVQTPALNSAAASSLPVVGTLDMGDLASALMLPSCSDGPSLSPPPGLSVAAAASTVYSELGRTGGSGHGATRSVACVFPYEQSVRSPAKSPQQLVCDRGKWHPTNSQEDLLMCRIPCVEYTDLDHDLQAANVTITSASGGVQDGATRVLRCDSGYAPLNSAITPETLVCEDGTWQRRTLECARSSDGASSALLEAVCGTHRISDFVTSLTAYSLRQVLSTNAATAATGVPKGGSNVKFTLWALSCSRGYIGNAPTPQALMCVNETLAAAPTFAVADWDLSLPRSAAAATVRAEQAHLVARQQEMLTQLASGHAEILGGKNGNSVLQSLQCIEDVRALPKVASTRPGMSDAALYCLIFGSMLGAIAACLLAYYLKKTRCFRQPFNLGSPTIGGEEDSGAAATKKAENWSPTDTLQGSNPTMASGPRPNHNRYIVEKSHALAASRINDVLPHHDDDNDRHHRESAAGNNCASDDDDDDDDDVVDDASYSALRRRSGWAGALMPPHNPSSAEEPDSSFYSELDTRRGSGANKL